MTDQAQSAARHDLVGLYAGRIQSRYQRPAHTTRQQRAGSGVHTFGRRPAVRQLGSSRSRRAVTALMATAMVAGSSPAFASGADYQSEETHAALTSESSYVIQEGDTLSGIAEQHGVSVEELARINKIENPDLIYAGDQLSLGGDDPAVSTETSRDIEVGDTIYEIKEGDTLFEIAYAHGVDLNELLGLNDIPNPNLIYAGDALILPTSDVIDVDDDVEIVGQQENDDGQPEGDDNIVGLHLVARGETLSSIASRYGISLEQLVAANGIEDSNMISAGVLLSIPGVQTSENSDTADQSSSAENVAEDDGTGTILSGMPALQQSLTLSCESAALSIATGYWGYQVSEWVFIENMPYHPNPHHGFRGDMNGPFGGTDDYGVYAKPLSGLLANYGFVGEEFYTQGDPTELKARIDSGQPVVVWMTSMASVQERYYDSYEGEIFTLVPEQHAVVVYGYDEDGVHVSDPGDGSHRFFGWDDFIRSWSYFDGMSMAVYPTT